MEHVPEDALPSVLSHMKAQADRCFFVISTRYAEQLLSNGQNAHCTVKPDEWWEDLIRAHFPYVQQINIDNPSTCAFITWPLADGALRKLHAINQKEHFRRKAKRSVSRLIVWLKINANWFAKKDELFLDLKGKSVAVVGNAKSLAEHAYGDDIDAHDLVIRLNRAPIASLRSHGRRTDWIATGIALDTDFARRRGADRVLWLSQRRQDLTRSMMRDRRMFVLPHDDYRMLKKVLGSAEPSSGLKMIDLLSRSECHKVDIYGFDFFNTISLSNPKHMAGLHNFNLEKQFVHELCARDSRFRVIGQPNK